MRELGRRTRATKTPKQNNKNGCTGGAAEVRLVPGLAWQAQAQRAEWTALLDCWLEW